MRYFRGVIAAAALLGTLLACSTAPQEAGTPDSTEILWDVWGVAHIFAHDSETLFYALGWAQARAHGDLLLELIGKARGRAAEYWGGEANLDSDRWIHTMGVPARAEAWYERQGAFKSYLDRFAAGINAYAEAHPEAIDETKRVVLPVTPEDVLAHYQRIIHFTFVVSPRNLTSLDKYLERGASGSRGANSGGGSGALAPLTEALPGSNAWAIGPSRSTSGNAILVANPHLPWGDLFTWFEVQLTSPDIDAYGATLVGAPFHGIAFNDHLGWTHTVNTHDGYDLYELTLTDDGYLFDGEVRAFESDEHVLKVRQEDGSLVDEPLTVKRSIHGPVLAERDGRALALRVVGLDAAGSFEQYWEMSRATNFVEFRAAHSRLQMPMFTTVYADRDGRILHHFGGETPVRGRGDWEVWQQPVPGDSSEWLWTDVHAYDDLPAALDPDSGWLQNANDPPWTTTFPAAMDPDAHPPYMAPRFMHFRAQRSARMLMEDDSIDFEEAVGYKLSTRMELADRLLDDLADAVADSGDAEAGEAMVVLEAWDGLADNESRGAVLFARFARELLQSGFDHAVPWSEEAPMTTPDGFAKPSVAVEALVRAARSTTEDFGSLDVPWGEVYRVRRGDRDLPSNGGSGALGIFRVVSYRPAEENRMVAAAGDSWVGIVEFSDPPRAVALLSYGNSSQPGSPHNGDQLELFSKKEMRPVWRSREEVESHLAERESIP
jgi:acyl-homoserine-lactone acylase